MATSLSPSKLFLLAALFSVGCLLGLTLIGVNVVQRHEYRDAIEAKGVVVAVEERAPVRIDDDSSSKEPTYAAVIRWEDSEGVEHEFVSQTATRPAPEIGSVTPVEYLPGDPYSAREATFFGKWLLALVGGILTVCFAVIAVSLALVGRGRL